MAPHTPVTNSIFQTIPHAYLEEILPRPCPTVINFHGLLPPRDMERLKRVQGGTIGNRNLEATAKIILIITLILETGVVSTQKLTR